MGVARQLWGLRVCVCERPSFVGCAPRAGQGKAGKELISESVSMRRCPDRANLPSPPCYDFRILRWCSAYLGYHNKPKPGIGRICEVSVAH